ncbi:MAG: hypothetical protein WC759_00970 [Candidatus Micrarchaeia archaeon]|jgi:hypothetical protein
MVTLTMNTGRPLILQQERAPAAAFGGRGLHDIPNAREKLVVRGGEVKTQNLRTLGKIVRLLKKNGAQNGPELDSVIHEAAKTTDGLPADSRVMDIVGNTFKLLIEKGKIGHDDTVSIEVGLGIIEANGKEIAWLFENACAEAGKSPLTTTLEVLLSQPERMPFDK